MSSAHTTTLTLSSGTEVDVFDRYTITLSMLTSGNAWTFSLWRSATRQATWDVLRSEVKLGENVTVAVDGSAQVTGRIETIETHVERGGATMVISGRDLAGPAMTWDADPTVRLRGLSLSDALTALFAPLGVPLLIADGAAARAVQSGTTRNARGVRAAHPRRPPIDQSHPRPGEHVWALAEAMCRRVGYLLWTAPAADGGIVAVVDAPAFSTPDVYTFGRRVVDGDATGNILTSVEKLSIKATPTEVNVYTGTTRGDLVSNRSRSQTFNLALSDDVVTRGLVASPMPTQPRHVHSPRARSLAAAANEGQRAVADAMADFRRYTVTVQGHAQSGRLYAVNAMARVRDDLTTNAAGDPLDESMLITDVTFEGGRSTGTTTSVTLVPKNSILITPEAA